MVSINDLPEELRELIDELKRRLVPGRGGDLTAPNPKDDPEFYRYLDLLIDTAKDQGIKLTQKDIADLLGVPYARLRQRITQWHKIKDMIEGVGAPETVKEAKEVGELQARMEEMESGIEIEPPGMPEKPSTQKPKHVTAQVVEDITVSQDVAVAVAHAVKRVFRKLGESVAKEEAEKMITLGVHFYKEYSRWCYSHGFKDLKECIDHVMGTYDNLVEESVMLKNRVEELEREVAGLKAFAKILLRKTLEKGDPEFILASVQSMVDRILDSCIDPDKAMKLAEQLYRLAEQLIKRVELENVAIEQASFGSWSSTAFRTGNQ